MITAVLNHIGSFEVWRCNCCRRRLPPKRGAPDCLIAGRKVFCTSCLKEIFIKGGYSNDLPGAAKFIKEQLSPGEIDDVNSWARIILKIFGFP